MLIGGPSIIYWKSEVRRISLFFSNSSLIQFLQMYVSLELLERSCLHIHIRGLNRYCYTPRRGRFRDHDHPFQGLLKLQIAESFMYSIPHHL